MDFGPFVNATWAGLPRPLQWALRLIFRRTFKAKVHKEKPTSTTSAARGPDTSTEARLSQQPLNSEKMTNAEADTMPHAEKRPERTAWGVTWLVFLLSIIPVVVLTLSLLAVAGCTSASPGIPEIYLYSLDTVPSGISLRIGYAGICAVRVDGPTTCTTTHAWSNPEDISAALFESAILEANIQEKKVVVSIQSYDESDHAEDTTAVLVENSCAAIGEKEAEPTTAIAKEEAEPTTIISSSAYDVSESAMPHTTTSTTTATVDASFFSSSPEPISTTAITTHSPKSQPPLTSSLAPLEATTSWLTQPTRQTSVVMLPVLTTASTTPLPVPTNLPSPSPSTDAGPPTEAPSPPPATPDFDPVKATALALSYQRAEPPFPVLTIVFFILALIQFALLRALPHHIPRLRPFVARNKCSIRVVAWILILVALLMGGLGTEWACWYASRAGSVVEVDSRGGHATRDVEQRYQLRYGGSRALFLLQLFAEMTMLLPVVCALITNVEVWVLRAKSGGGEIEKAKNLEAGGGADQEMDNLGLAEEGRARDDRSSSDSESSHHLQAPPRQSEKCSVISVSLSDTHLPEETLPLAHPEAVAGVSRDSTTPHHIPRAWTGAATTSSFGFSASQYTCSEFSGSDEGQWCDASPVYVAKGAKLVDIGSLRKRGGD